MRKLKFHEQKLLKHTDLLNWKKESNVREMHTIRRYHIYRKADKKLLCKGETLWIMINLEKSRPTKIPQNVVDLFWKTTDFYVEDISDLI